MQNFGASTAHYPAKNFYFVIQPGMIQDLQRRMHRPSFEIVRAVDQPPNARVNHGSGTHCARLNCNKEITIAQAMIPECRARLAQCNYLCMCRRIGVFDIPIKSASNDLPVMHDDCSDRNFTRFERPLRQPQGLLHPELIEI